MNSLIRSTSAFSFLLSAAMLAACSQPARAQQYSSAPPPPGYAQPYPAPPPPVSGPGYANLFANLSDGPSTHTGFVFDNNMMDIARGVLIDNGLDERRAAAAVTGISIDNYHFRQPAFYVPEAMAQLAATYRANGWTHLIDQNKTPGASAAPRVAYTDLWLHHHGADIDAVTVLRRGPKEMYVLQLTGDLRPLDLLHLGGKFGIPKVDPNTVMVPAP